MLTLDLAWAIGPFAAEVFALVLLFLTILKSRRGNGMVTVPWKSSATALLFHDVVRVNKYGPLQTRPSVSSKTELKDVSKLSARLTTTAVTTNG
jgi:hypothetical protein